MVYLCNLWSYYFIVIIILLVLLFSTSHYALASVDDNFVVESLESTKAPRNLNVFDARINSALRMHSKNRWLVVPKSGALGLSHSFHIKQWKLFTFKPTLNQLRAHRLITESLSETCPL